MFSSTASSAARASAFAAASARPSAPPAALPLSSKKQFASWYRDFASLPVAVGARFETPASSDRVMASLSQRDLAVDTFRRWQQTHALAAAPAGGAAPEDCAFDPIGYPLESAGVVSATPSPSGRLIAVVRTSEKRSALGSGGAAPAPAGPGPNLTPATNKVYWIDILTRRGVLCSIPLDSAHGRVYAGTPFGGLVWAREEDAVAYCAEPHPPQRRSLFEGTAHGVQPFDRTAAVGALAAAEADAFGGTGHDYTQDWGEQLNFAVSPALFVCDIATRTVAKVPGVPAPSVLSAAAPKWTYGAGTAAAGGSGCERGLTFIGFPVTPRRFGLIYYNCRPAQAYFVPLPSAGKVGTLAVKAALADPHAPTTATPAAAGGASAADSSALPLANTVDGGVNNTGAGAASPEAAAAGVTPVAAGASAAAAAAAAAAPVTAVCLTPDDASVVALDFNHDFSVLAYTATSLADADAPVHCATLALRTLAWPAQLSTLTSTAEEEKTVAEAGAAPSGTTQYGSWHPTLAPRAPGLPAPVTVIPVFTAHGGVSRGRAPATDAVAPPAAVTLPDSAFPGLYPGAWEPESPTVWVTPSLVALDTYWRSVQTVVIADVAAAVLANMTQNVERSATLYRLNFDAASLPPLLRAPAEGPGFGGVACAFSAPSASILDVIPARSAADDAPAQLLISLSLPHASPVIFRLTFTRAQLLAAAAAAGATEAVPYALSPSVTSPLSPAHGEVTVGALVAAGAQWLRVTISALEDLVTPVSAGGYAETDAVAAAAAALGASASLYSPSLTAPLTVAAAAAAGKGSAGAESGTAQIALPSAADVGSVIAGLHSYTLQVPHDHAHNRTTYPAGEAPVDYCLEVKPHFEALVSVHPERFAAGARASAAEQGVTPPPCRGVVLFPHGGPHSAFTTGYDFATSYLATLGLAVVRVNFRGSTGFGHDALTTLPGYCGAVDVDDCIAAYEAACDVLDAGVARTGAGPAAPARSLPAFLFGGSHGGYLVTHLAGQFPGRFAAVVARNAVISLPYTVATSDIPDWCFAEAGVAFDPRYVMSKETLARMWDVSPVAHAEKYVTPTLLAIGTGDRRVPPEQSLDFYRLLQAKGVPARLTVYQGAQHGLNDKPLIHADSMVSAALWFAQFGGVGARK